MKKEQNSPKKQLIPDLRMIACVSKDWGLGKGNDLLWRIPEDMRFFRTTTTGNTVVMGGKTYQSIGKPLPNRENLVLSRTLAGKISDEPYRSEDGIRFFATAEELNKYLSTLPGQKFIIGGARMYAEYLDCAEAIYLTEVASTKPADVYFPEFDKSSFARKVLQTGEKDGVKYEIVEYIRK